MFKDEVLQSIYEQQGYVKVPFLNEQEVAFLTTQHNLLMAQQKEAFYTSLISQNAETKAKINAIVTETFNPKLAAFFTSVKPVIASFLTKEKGVSGRVDSHQDWTFVDESRFRSLHIWCPLVATNSQNGNLEVLPGSHKLPTVPRCSPVSYAPYKSEECNEFVKRNLKAEPTAAGEAIIYDSSLIHFSPPNLTDSKRIAASMLVVPAEATPLLMFAQSETVAVSYEIDTAFLIGYTAGAKPNESQRIGEVTFNLIEQPLEELQRTTLKKEQGGIWNKVKNLLR